MRILGLLIATGGGVAIGLGWAGAAQVDCVDCQIPFLLSGGAAGIGLIIFGVALMLLAQIRTESRRLGDRVEHALATRLRPEEQQRPAAAASEPPAREQPAVTSPIAEPRGEDAAATAVTPEPRPEAAALAASGPAPDALSAVPVDTPASEPDAASSDAATVAATTVAGGVVDAEDESSALAATPPTDQPQGGVSVHPPQHEASPEAPSQRGEPGRRRGLFRRRKGP